LFFLLLPIVTMKVNQLIRYSAPLGVFLGACYTVRPLETSQPQPATIIVAQLTDSGTVVMANAIGPGAEEVEGLVSGADANTWSLNLKRVDHRGGTSVMWNQELVSFPRYALTHVTEKRLDRGKSWIAGVGIAACAFIVARLFHVLGADTNTNIPPPAPN
jgi:hypothetical protein